MFLYIIFTNFELLIDRVYFLVEAYGKKKAIPEKNFK